MKRQTFLKSTLCLLMAMLCNVSWAQTVVGALGNPTTTLTDGHYVLVAKSSKNNGNAGPVFFNTTASGRKYQYDTNSPLGVGDAVLSKYVWTIDETTDENGVQHITITNVSAASLQRTGDSKFSSILFMLSIRLKITYIPSHLS